MFNCDAVDTARYYDKLEDEIYKLSGYTIRQLASLFSVGYTLQPPKTEPKFREPVTRPIA